MVLSNAVLVVTPSPSELGLEDDIIIRDQLHEVLEAIPCIPKLQKLTGLLRGREYDEGHEEDEDDMYDETEDRPVRSPCELS